MLTIRQIKDAINALGPAEFQSLCRWLREQDWAAWDRQIEQDSRAGRLDFLSTEAREEKGAARVDGPVKTGR